MEYILSQPCEYLTEDVEEERNIKVVIRSKN